MCWVVFEVTVGSSNFPRRFHPKVSKGLSGFNAWLSRVDDAHFAVCRFLSFEMDELMKLLSVEDVLHGFRHLNGFEQAQRQLLVSHRLINETDSESSDSEDALSGSSSFEEMSNSE